MSLIRYKQREDDGVNEGQRGRAKTLPCFVVDEYKSSSLISFNETANKDGGYMLGTCNTICTGSERNS